MNNRQNQAWFLIQHLRGQDLTVDTEDGDIFVSKWQADRPRDIDPEVRESLKRLKLELLLILRLEQRLMLARIEDGRPRRKRRWKYRRRERR
jgi:hypothetical protein